MDLQAVHSLGHYRPSHAFFLPPRVLGSLMRALLSYFPGDVSESMLRTLRFNLRRTLQVTEKEIAERFGFAPPTRTLAAQALSFHQTRDVAGCSCVGLVCQTLSSVDILHRSHVQSSLFCLLPHFLRRVVVYSGTVRRRQLVSPSHELMIKQQC